MVWSKQKQIGDVPTRRSGHSMVISNQGGTPFAYMFGGCDNRKPPGPNAELYKLDMSDPAGYYWQMIAAPEGAGPAPRWHHTANMRDEKTMVVFGGFSGSKHHRYYNDVWLLDTATDTWSQPPPGETNTDEKGIVTCV